MEKVLRIYLFSDSKILTEHLPAKQCVCNMRYPMSSEGN